MIKLQDFAAQQGVTDRQIQRLIKKYESEIEGKFERRGPNGTWLSDEACEILRGKMKKQPIAVFDEDPQVKRMEAELRDLREQMKEKDDQMKEKDKMIYRLIDQNQQLQLEAGKVHLIEAKASEAAERAATAEKEKKEAEDRAAAAELALTKAEDRAEDFRCAAEISSQEAEAAKKEVEKAKAEVEITEKENKAVWKHIERIQKRTLLERILNKNLEMEEESESEN